MKIAVNLRMFCGGGYSKKPMTHMVCGPHTAVGTCSFSGELEELCILKLLQIAGKKELEIFFLAGNGRGRMEQRRDGC